MNIGMLWFDNDPKAEINTKIERAAVYYRSKYGRQPNLCFVNPCMVHPDPADSNPAPMKSGEIEVRTSRSVLPNHFWIGVNGTVAPTES